MSKLNKILSFIICFAMVVISVPAVSMVSADTTTYATEFVIEDNTEYASFDGATNWSFPESEYVDVGVDDDGNITYTHKKQAVYVDGSQNLNAAEKLVYTLPESTISEDLENKTKITTNNYTGNVKITVVLDTVANDTAKGQYKKENDSASGTIAATWFTIGIGDGTKNAIGSKLYPTYATTINSSSSKVGDNQFSSATDRTIVYTIDTTADTVSAASGGRTAETTLTSDVKYISQINFSGLQRFDVGSQITVDSVKVEVIPAFTEAEKTMLNTTLPVNLVEDINNVTDDITLPDVEGVTWTSSNPAVISDTGDVFKKKGETQDATLIANVTVDGVTYKKYYAMTVAAADNLASFYVDGEIYDSVEVKSGGKLAAINAPYKEGMTFVGWYEDGASESFDFNTVLNGDINLYAKYEITKYKIYFRVDSFIDESLTKEVAHGWGCGQNPGPTGGLVPAVPEKAGYPVIGWKVAGTENILLSEDIVVESDMYVDAVYGESGATAHTVTFVNGEETVATVSAWPGYTFKFPANPTRANYTFSHWARNGEEFKETDVMLNKDITLEAVFNPNPVDVKFYSDESTLYLTGTGYYDTAYGTLPGNPSMEGKAFQYWQLENGDKFTAETVITDPVNVYAVWTVPVVIVNEDITKYTSLTDGLIQFEECDTGYTSLSFDNGLKMTLTKWEPINNKGDANGENVTGLAANFRALVASDDASRTKTYMNHFVGEYEIELVYDIQTVRVKEYDGVSLTEAYMHYNMGARADDGTYSAAPFTGRLKNFVEGGQGLSVHGYDANKKDKSVGLGMVANQPEHTYTVHFNTYTDKATAWSEASAGPLGGDIVWTSTPDYINAVNVAPILRLGVGSYYKLKNVKITEFNTDRDSEGYKATMGLIEQLPDSLVADPNAVTESFTMPNVEGITWTTSDSTIIDVNGTVSRWYDDLDVVLTATATSADGYKYSKEYALTVKAFDFEKETVAIEMNKNNWSFANRADQQEAKYTFDGETVKIEKVTEAENAASTKESKTYYAYFDLYSENSSDEYTVTSVNNYEGVYDIEIDIENGVTSTVPMNVAIGYKNGDSFFSTATLKVSGNTILLTYLDSGETTANATVYAANAKNPKLKVRVDAVSNLLSAWIDGKIAFRNIPYVSPFPVTSGIDMFSTVRIGVDTNNNAGDYIVVKDINMEKITAEEISSVNSAINAAAGITVYDLTNTPENVSDNLKALPSKAGDYAIKWVSDSNQVDVKTGEVFFNQTASDVVVTAYISDSTAEYPVTVRKDFKLHLRERESDAEYGQYLINSLGKITNQDYDNIRYDLNLPVNNDITWTSSNTSLIGADGKINMSAEIYASEKVKITASAYGSSKEYIFTVAPRTAQNTLYTGTIPATLSYGSYSDLKLSANAITSFAITGSDAEGKINIVDENGNVIVSTVVEDGSFYFDYKGSVYTEHSLAENVTKNIKILTMPDVDKIAIWVDGVITDDYVDFRTAADYIAKVETTNSELKVTGMKVETDDYGMLTLNIDNLDYYGNVGRGILSGDITLPTASITNADVNWQSGNTSLLTNEGKVKIPDNLSYTTLKFTITDKADSNVYIEKNFDIIVECDNSQNLASNANVTVSKLENMSYAKTNVNDGDYDTVYRVTSASTKPSDIIFDLGSDKLVNTMLIIEDADNIREFTLYASKDNSTWTEVKSGDMANVENSTVKFDTLTARYMKLTIETSNASIVDINEIKFYLFATAEELAQLDMSTITVPSTASKDLTLVTLGANGTVIKWTSSNEDVISTTGKLTKPETACTVTLTATAEGTDITKTFEVYVSASNSSGPAVIGGGGFGGGGGAGGGMSGANANVTVGPDITVPIYTEEVKDETEVSTSTVYSDVKSTDWFANAVLKLTEKCIVSGDGTGKFNPQDKVTREQFLKMLIEAADIATDNADNTFVDVIAGAWYADYVLTAKKLGIVNGMSEIEFGIGSPISRQDMAVFIERLINIKNLEVTKYEVEDFADAADVSAYAADAVANMKAIGLIQGYNNMYNPKDNLTRAEAATVIASLLELIEK